MKNWVKRALRTFFQSAIGYIVVAIPSVDFSSPVKTTLIGIGISALAAGISAVMNFKEE